MSQIGQPSVPRRHRPSVALRLLLALLIGCAATAIWFAYVLFRTLHELPDAYAKWDTGNLLIEFMETHNGAWPKRREDLQECYTLLNNESHGLQDRHIRSGQSFGEIRSRIGIDWDARPDQLVLAAPTSDGEPFRVVWSLSGSTTVWEGAEPNQMILDYLTAKAATRPSGP